MTAFKLQYTFEERKKESDRVRTKYPDRIPVICERANKSSMEIMEKVKFLIPYDLTVGQFMYVIRKRLKLPSEKAIFLFVNGSFKQNSAHLSSVYEDEHDNDGFLYVVYSDENVFGSYDT